MPFTETNGLKYFTFGLFDRAGLKHGIFTRRGGVSQAPWNSLNTGGLNGDERANVVENRRRIFSTVNLPVESIYDVWQVHSSAVIYTERPRPLESPHLRADAIFTNRSGVCLFMRFGDCVPLLFLDPIRRVIGIAHAGWQGTIKLIAQKIVYEMVRQLECRPEDIIAGIGPSIGPDHYPIGTDVTSKVIDVFDNEQGVLEFLNSKTYFNLWQANFVALRRAGVRQIEMANICTACHPDDWFSHRKENGKTGRFAALISLD